uniref:RRM domain-containing protein n=1 Tax=Picea sitchensis TaxID=3332 RepID=A9NWV4_PICSI|nr:unknown [Picea sitchensis]ACN39792.1 unknown [Picea sitchensis]ACN40610.1 unknown [Picea sitchensis]ADE77751.1 unknown [Picea sitchensis]
MPGNPLSTLFIGNLDDRVDERVLYEVMIQAGPLVDLYIPRDKETNRHKGYAFAEYETEEVAQYAIKLFSGLVCLHNKFVRFAISGQDKSPQTQIAVSASPSQRPPIQSPIVSGKQMPPPSLPSPIQVNSSRHLPYHSPISSYPSAYNSLGATKNGYNLEKFSHSQSFNNNSKVEPRRFDSYLSPMSQLGHRSSVHGSGQSFAYPSY